MSTRFPTLGLAALLVLAAALAAACGDDDGDPAAPAPATGPTGGSAPDEVQLTDADDGTTVQLANGGTLVVALPSNPSTGFGWSVGQSSSPELQLQGEPAFVPGGSTLPVPGAGGTEVFTFEAVDAGTAGLTLEYRRPIEPGVAPEQTFSVTVEIE